MHWIYSINIDITPDLAHNLIAEQFPEYADLPITDVEKQGHDNRIPIDSAIICSFVFQQRQITL